MALNSWQKITRVLPSNPFGRGTLGAYSSATIPTMTKDSCSGTATSTTLTTSGSTFANGDLLLIHQTRGTGAGQWEIALVSSGGGSTSLTLSTALQYTYTDDGAASQTDGTGLLRPNQAQAVKINEYTDVTAQSGTWTTPNWDGGTGGILTFACNGTFTPTATLSGVGGNSTAGTSGYPTGARSAGFAGGRADVANTDADSSGECGEGSAANMYYTNGAANGNGGGAGHGKPGAYGAGGSHATSGGTGNSCEGAGCTIATAGSTVGDANLQALFLGGGGGGACRSTGDNCGGGGAGGGIYAIWAKTISAPTNILAYGGNGSGTTRGGGGGAGGSILLCAQTVDIGTDKLSTAAGSGGTGGGAGGKGRIAVYYGGSLSGSVSSTYYGSLTTELDSSLFVATSGATLNYSFFM